MEEQRITATTRSFRKCHLPSVKTTDYSRVFTVTSNQTTNNLQPVCTSSTFSRLFSSKLNKNIRHQNVLRQAARTSGFGFPRDLLPKIYRVREATLTCSCTRNLTNISENFLGWWFPGPSPAVNVPLQGRGGESQLSLFHSLVLETCTTLLNQRYISSIYQSQFDFYSGIFHPSFVVILHVLALVSSLPFYRRY